VNAGYNLKSESSNGLAQNFYSFSFASAYRLNKNFQMGFAYQNDYSFNNISNSAFGDADTNTLETHSFKVPVVYEYKWLRFGMNINLSYFHARYSKYVTGNLWKLIPEFGTIVTPHKQFSIGASFTPGFTGYPSYNTNSNLYFYDNLYVKYPNRFKISAEFRSYNNDTKFTFDYHYINNSVIAYRKDQNDIHLGFEHLIDENWAFRCGFFSMLRNDDHKIFFLTFGTSFIFNNYSFNLAGLVSMAGNSGKGEFYVVNFGAGYEF